MTTSFIVIDKQGTLKEQKTRALTKDCLYKKCGFRKSDGFENIHVWSSDSISKSYTIELWGKVTGKNGQENLYNFPFLNGNTVYYGPLALIAVDNNSIIDLTADLWHDVYNHLTQDNTKQLANVPNKIETNKDPLEYESDDEDITQMLSSGSELEEEEYYYSD
jgi:hypothetical protein